MKLKRFKKTLKTAGALALVSLWAGTALAAPWSFGIMADTQWKTSPDNKNPNTVAVNPIRHVNEQFIGHGVKFVIQTGDVVENGTNLELDTHATFRQVLYNAGIGFYPLRGNHESSRTAAIEFQRVFPQTGAVAANAGKNNATPADAFVNGTIYGVQTKTSPSTFTVGSNFVTLTNWEGLTYSFDYDNVRFVLVDQFTSPKSGIASHSVLNSADVEFVRGRVSDSNRPAHAFSFAHKGFITENHRDGLFGNSDANPSGLQDLLLSYLYENGVRYHFNGHDHMHHRASIKGLSDPTYKVQNVTTSSDSYKYYIPANLTADQMARETPIAQEIFTLGYYIVTVDGPRVTVDHYASANGCNGDCDQKDDAGLYSFTKRESFGYSLNGKEILVGQGAGLSLTDDTAKAVARGETGYVGTQMAIVDGSNTSTSRDYNLRPLTKAVDTGWAPKAAGTVSDILTLWGMHDSLATQISPSYQYVASSDRTDVYVLSMSFDPTDLSQEQLGGGAFGLAARDAEGNWLNAVSKNSGGAENFVQGPYVAGYPLGSYGIDTATNTAWAVVNHQGDFAVADFAEGSPELYGLISRKAGPASARVWTLKLVNGPSVAANARIDGVTLSQTSGAACTPVMSNLTSFPLPYGNIGPAESALNSVQYDFSGCAPTARFTATVSYSADGGAVTGSKTFYNQFR